MRTVFTLFLTGLILACPFLCGAAEAVGGAHEHHGAGQPGAPAPAHCPEDADSCVCRGAVPNGDVKVPGLDAIGLPLPLGWLAGPMALGASLAPTHLARDGTPAGLAAWGSSSAVRAFLQNYRC